MPANEKTKKVVNLKSMCICTDCPTYTICAKKANEGLFCWFGGTINCISKDNDCLCQSCPVTSVGGVQHDFFCPRGLDKSQCWDE